MKFKIAAGAEIDLLTKPELDAALRSWGEEYIRGRRYRKINAQGTVAADGTVSIGGASDPAGMMGPDEGFVWSVKRLIFSGIADGKFLDLWLNEPSASTLVESGITGTTLDPTRTQAVRWGSNQLVLQAGERLLVTGSSLTAGATITVSGQTMEAPAGFVALL